MQFLHSLSGIILGKSSAVCGGILAVKNRKPPTESHYKAMGSIGPCCNPFKIRSMIAVGCTMNGGHATSVHRSDR